MLRATLFALVLGICLAPAADSSSSNALLLNGSLETDSGNQWPDKWEHPKTGCTWEQEGGNHFLRLTSTEPGKLVVLYHPVSIPQGTEALELTWRWRVHDLTPGKQAWFDARIMMEFSDGKGTKVKPAPSAPSTRKNIDGWTTRSVKFLVPTGAHTLELMPSLFQVQSGVLDIDDLALTAIDAAPLREAALASASNERTKHDQVEKKKGYYIAPETSQPAKWPQPLHVSGNQVLNQDGKSVWLQGLNVVSLEFQLRGEHVMKSALVAVDEWKASIIRLPVREDYWFGSASGQVDGGREYRELVEAVITLVANRGAYVLLDLHRFHTPLQIHADFWTSAAAMFKDHPAVLFDLFNEPHGTTWEVWRNGGYVPDSKAPTDASKGLQSIGMQALLNAVRATGARNVVIVGGLDWAYDLSGIAKGFELEEKTGNGIIYATHIYPWKRGWQDKVLVVADKHPILLGEVGADIKKMNFIPLEAQEDPSTWVPDMLGFIQKHHLHWTGFSFHPAATPVMISDWNYTPTPFWGAFAKRALAGEKFEMHKMR